MKQEKRIVVRGGGDLATGVAIVLVREGFRVLITELPAPLVVRRKVSFAQAVFDGICVVEEVTGEHALSPAQVDEITSSGKVAILDEDPVRSVGRARPTEGKFADMGLIGPPPVRPAA